MNTLGLRRVLSFLAGAVSLSLFVGLIFISYTLTKNYEQHIANRLAIDLASAVAQLAYRDPTLWSFQTERIASKVETELQNEEPSMRGWSVGVFLNDGQLIYERHADPARFNVVSAETIKVGFVSIGRIEVLGEVYVLPRRIAWTSLFAFLLSITLFLVLYFIPYRAVRTREASLTDALALAKKSEDDARASSDRLNRAITSMQDGFALFDQHNRLVLWNLPYQKIIEDWELTARLDAGLDELLSKLSTAVVEQIERVSDLETVGNKFAEANDQREVTTPTGRQIDWQRVATVSGDSLIVVRDITEQKKTEEQLRQAQKMEAVGQLTGGVAHDFNNLLAVIMGNTEILQDRLGREDKLLNTIQRATTRGAELTQRLLAYSRRQPLSPRAIDLGDLVSGTSELLIRTLGATIEIETGVAPGLWHASADPGQVENALLNLALNASDAMLGGGKLTIECSNAVLDESYAAENTEAKAGDYVLLAVSDTGTGMAAEVQAHAFEPFFTTKEVGQGSGLGLSMIYGFAKQSGGHVTIYSEEGRGTTVKLYLPRAGTALPTEETLPSEAVPRGSGEVILVIEDDPDVCDVAVQMLEGLGYRVIDVPDAASAQTVLADGKSVDLVLSDVVLPGGVSGPDFAEETRASYPDLKVIFMSGYPDQAAKRNGFLGSDNVLLNKPFQRQQLAKALRGELDGSSAK